MSIGVSGDTSTTPFTFCNLLFSPAAPVPLIDEI
jgi:hypothetical protein